MCQWIMTNHVVSWILLVVMMWYSEYVSGFEHYIPSNRQRSPNVYPYQARQFQNQRFDKRIHIGKPSWVREYQRLEAARERLLPYRRRNEMYRNAGPRNPNEMAQRRIEVTNRNFFKMPNTEGRSKYDTRQRSYYYRPMPETHRMNEVKRTFRTPLKLRFTNKSPYGIFDRYGGRRSAVGIASPTQETKLERKIQMLQNIKRAIIEKHKLNRQSELVKKEMLEWAKGIMKPKKHQVNNNKVVAHPVGRKANNSFIKPKPAQNSKKTFVPHVQETTTSGWRRHRIFHETAGSRIQPRDREWEYKKFHIYHKTLPLNEFVQSKRVIVPYNDQMGINADDDDEDMDDDDDDGDATDDATTPIFSDDDDDEEDDLPSITPAKQLNKIPVLNIETPNMKGIPESARSQLERSPLPEFNIDKGFVTSPADLREPGVDNDEYLTNKPKSGEVDKKSLLNDENMLENFMHGDLSGKSMNKDKMSAEELEAVKEDQDASKMMKIQEKNKFEEQPEVLGLDKKGLSATDKESISARFSNGAVPDPGLIGREGVDSSVDFPKTMKSDESVQHHATSHRAQLKVAEDTDASNRKSENAVDKQVIDGDMEEHHPMNELDSFQGPSKKIANDYESYDNGQTPGDFKKVMDQTDEDRDPNYLKPVDTNHGSTIVEDTIRKLQDHDEMESDKLVKKFASGFQQHPLEDSSSNSKSSYALTPDYTHDNIQPPSSSEAAIDETQQDDQSDLLDPMKAQERAIHLSEAAEIANKLHGTGKDQSNTFVKNQYPSTADIADSLLKSNPHSTSFGFSQNRFAALSSKFDALSPEDALHALNGKAALNDILAKNTNDEGPPDAVVNAIQSPNPLANTLVKTTKERLEKKKEDAVSAEKAKEQNNSTTANIAISDIENATVAKEVVSILESLGQVKNSIQAEKLANESHISNPAVAAIDTVLNTTSNTNSEGKSKVVTNNTTQHGDSSTNSTSVEGNEEKETKEAVRDLNIAIGILEKKLAIMNEAKKSGNAKAIYIVDQTLRNSKGVAKSNITRHHKNHHQVRRRHRRHRRQRHRHRRRHHRKNSTHYDVRKAHVNDKIHFKRKKLHIRRKHQKKT